MNDFNIVRNFVFNFNITIKDKADNDTEINCTLKK
jgi:hypothetical protein